MTRLDPDILREALRAGHDPGAPIDVALIDVALIMDRGRRLRRRRRVAAAAGTLCALALLTGAGTGIADLAGSSPASVAAGEPRQARHARRAAPRAPADRHRGAGHAGPRPDRHAVPGRLAVRSGTVQVGPRRFAHRDTHRSRRLGPAHPGRHGPVNGPAGRGEPSARPLAVVIALSGPPGTGGRHRGPCGQRGSRDVNDVSGPRASAPRGTERSGTPCIAARTCS